MNILALDTSTEACSVAIYSGDKIIEEYQLAPRRHAELILGMVDSLLEQSGLKLSELDAIAFGCGPGAFTGVRIAASVVQGLAFANALPVIPVSTLAAMAHQVSSRAGFIISAIDARMSEIYLGIYEVESTGVLKLHEPECVCKPGDFSLNIDSPCYGVGSGWKTYEKVLTEKSGALLSGYDPEAFPRAADILTLALEDFRQNKTQSAKDAKPVYLRNNVVRPKAN